jgi:ribonuclease P protein subunit POP4
MSAKDTENFAKAYDKLFVPLPPELGGSSEPSEECTKESVIDFLKAHVPASDQKEIEDELRKNVPLSKQKDKKIKKPQPKRKGKYLTARERRDLGLYKLPKEGGLKYSNFRNLHKLWLDYIREVLRLEGQPAAPQVATGHGGRISAILDEQLQLRVCRADLHGCLVKVTRSLNSAILGMQGIVVMETRNTFRIIDKTNILRTIPKNGTSFTFTVDDHVITLSGSSLCNKPSERAVKKWKNKSSFDL